MIITPSIFLIIAYYIAAFILNYLSDLPKSHPLKSFALKKLSINRKAIAAITIIVVTASSLSYMYRINNNDLRIFFIDVGQGDSALIISPTNRKVLIDGGGTRDTIGFDVGTQILLPYLLNRGVRVIDYVIISHFHSDHTNGLVAVFENISVRNVVISRQSSYTREYEVIMEVLERNNIPILIVEAGNRIILDNYTYIDILHPGERLIPDNMRGINNNSIVCRLVFGEFSMIFTGDIEDLGEIELVRRYGSTGMLESTILKVAHHGSGTSTTQEFVDSSRPQIAVVGVGRNNQFRSPGTRSNKAIRRCSGLEYIERIYMEKLG